MPIEAPPVAPAPVAPAAPTPAPSPAPAPAAPAPAPSPAPSASGPPDPVRDFDRELEDTFNRVDPTPAKKPEAGAPATKPAASPAERPKPEEPVKPVGRPPEFKDPKELRKAFEASRGELQSLNKRYADLEKRHAEAEAKGKDVTTLNERMSAIQKEADTLRSELRAAKHETSEDFKTRYEVPFQKAAMRAKGLVEQLTALDPETRAERPGTIADLQEIYALPFGKAAARAAELFGQQATFVLEEYKQLHRMEDDRNEALEQEKSQWKEKTQAEEANRIARNETMRKLDSQVTKDLAESVPDYHDDPTDTELAKARNEGYAIFDAKPKTFEEMVVKKAHLRHRFAAFGAQKLTILRLRKELAEAQAAGERRQGIPNPQGRQGGRDPKTDDGMSWEEAARNAIT